MRGKGKGRRVPVKPKPYCGRLARVLRVAPSVEDWRAYCRSVLRNRTEWGAK